MSTMSSPKPISPVPDLKTRRITLISFWSIFLLLGVPLWWKTTALEQRKLPEQRIQDWDRITKGEVSQSQGKLSSGVLPHSVEVNARASDYDDLLTLERYECIIDGRVVKYSPHYKLVFSLLNENSSTPNPLLSWDIDSLLRRASHSLDYSL